MKKIFNYLAAIMLLLAVSSCEKADYTIPDYVKHIAFDGVKSIINENSTDTLRVPVYLTTRDADLATEVAFEITNIEGGIPAVEGVDYKFLNKESFKLNGTDIFNYLEIVTFDNDRTEGDKNLVINISGSTTSGVQLGIGGKESNIYTVKIIDDEHPLAFLFGTYNVKGNSLREEIDKEWESTFISVEGSNTQLDIIGFWDGFDNYNDIRAVVDVANNTISIPSGQIIAKHAAYGNVYVVYVEDIDDERVVDTKRDIEGTINADGTVSFHNYGFYVNSAAATGFFDWFGTSTFTKK
ncbi:MAG: hypothetical protein KAG37_00680 [Flavobacteriales bacterium]|nr:hypothetical protein [Flavobacteriales bacterium]